MVVWFLIYSNNFVTEPHVKLFTRWCKHLRLRLFLLDNGHKHRSERSKLFIRERDRWQIWQEIFHDLLHTWGEGGLQGTEEGKEKRSSEKSRFPHEEVQRLEKWESQKVPTNGDDGISVCCRRARLPSRGKPLTSHMVKWFLSLSLVFFHLTTLFLAYSRTLQYCSTPWNVSS